MDFLRVTGFEVERKSSKGLTPHLKLHLALTIQAEMKTKLWMADVKIEYQHPEDPFHGNCWCKDRAVLRVAMVKVCRAINLVAETESLVVRMAM